jgi:hypothetical protein
MGYQSPVTHMLGYVSLKSPNKNESSSSVFSYRVQLVKKEVQTYTFRSPNAYKILIDYLPNEIISHC